MLSRFGWKKRYIEISLQIDLQEKNDFNYKEHRKGEGKDLTRFRQLFKVISWPEHNRPNYVFAFQHLSQQDDILLKESDKLFSFEEGFHNYQLIAIFEATVVRVESLENKGRYREQVRLSAIEGRRFGSKIVVGSFKQGVKAQENDVMLAGRKQFSFIEIALKFEPNSSEVIDLRQSETIEQDCEICVKEGSRGFKDLVRLCSCMELYVHVECLKGWISRNLDKRGDYLGRIKCCECRIRYLPKYVLRNRKYEPLHPSYCYKPSILYEEKDENGMSKIGLLTIPGDEEFKIGRQKGKNNLVVKYERSISDVHAGIKQINGALFVRDHESQYGTFIQRQNLQFRIYERGERKIQVRNIVFGFQLQRS